MMNYFNLKFLTEATQGQVLSQKQTEFNGYGTDTRKDLTGKIFFALRGESFDAHNFLDKAVAQGAGVLVVDQSPETLKTLSSQVSIVKVKDTLKALQDFAHHYRLKMPAKIVGITGSNGKTSCKEFAAAILNPYLKVHYSQGSFNNHWGVPMTLLELRAEHEVALVEMGMNHAGEITELVHIASPDIVMVNMVGRAHIEYFGTIDKIAEAKEEIYASAGTQATRIFNLDNPWTYKMYQKYSQKNSQIITFSEKQEADVCFKFTGMSLHSLKISGSIKGVKGEVQVPVFGKQNITNLMAASSAALACGLKPEQIWQSLPQCRTNWGRNQWLKTKHNTHILFDAYNANPDSMSALLDNISALNVPGQKYAVFAEMLELGNLAKELHEELGRKVAQAQFAKVWFYGPHSADFERGFISLNDQKKLLVSNTYEESLASQMASMLKAEDIVLVKGSRGMKLERFVEQCEPIDFSKKT